MTPEQLLAQVEFFASARASAAVAWATNDPAAASNFDTEAATALRKVRAEIERVYGEKEELVAIVAATLRQLGVVLGVNIAEEIRKARPEQSPGWPPPSGSERQLVIDTTHMREPLAGHCIRCREGHCDGCFYCQQKEAMRSPTQAPAKTACCDLHGPKCEAPSELCCHQCTEAGHNSFPTPHADGTPCVLTKPEGNPA